MITSFVMQQLVFHYPHDYSWHIPVYFPEKDCYYCQGWGSGNCSHWSDLSTASKKPGLQRSNWIRILSFCLLLTDWRLQEKNKRVYNVWVQNTGRFYKDESLYQRNGDLSFTMRKACLWGGELWKGKGKTPQNCDMMLIFSHH